MVVIEQSQLAEHCDLAPGDPVPFADDVLALEENNRFHRVHCLCAGFIGCFLIAADYFLCRTIIRKNHLVIQRPKLLHLADLILPVGMGAFIVSGLLGNITLWIRRPDSSETRYSIVYVILLIIIEALLITDRIFLIKFTTGRDTP